eukprot:SAG31_NODE_22897_length_515_cov_26.399038_1_plen_62_part_00
MSTAAYLNLAPVEHRSTGALTYGRRGLLRTVCKMIGFQGFWRFKAIYFSIGAFFVNIVGGN